MASIHELRAQAAQSINKAKAARDQFKSSKPSVLNATTKLNEALEVIDALIDAVECIQHKGEAQ